MHLSPPITARLKVHQAPCASLPLSFRVLLFLSSLGCLPSLGAHGPSLSVHLVKNRPSEGVVAFSALSDQGGNTSVAFDASCEYKWSGDSPYPHEPYGYFAADGKEIAYLKRDRDLGQTFFYAGPSVKRLKALTVRTGFGSNAVRAGMYGQGLGLQLFQVSGTARLHTNGSEAPREAFHGFPHKRGQGLIAPERDDYWVGETYLPLGTFRGGRFPTKADFGFRDSQTPVAPDHPALKGRYLRFELPSSSQALLQPGQTYAFLLLIEERGPDRGFTLANQYQGRYEGGHGLRRDGNGQFPPAPADPGKLFEHPDNQKARESALFPSAFEKRAQLPLGTNGYPDVCTWRDLEFYIEAE